MHNPNRPHFGMLQVPVVLGIMSVLLSCAFATEALVAQPPKMSTILYGASYYHEYMPHERLEQDVQLMKEAGLSVMRVGESTWSSWEPREGEFEFAWMERILDSLNRAGIKVILGTPTYSIPPWLFKKHPEILVTRLGGEKSFYGPRQNMDITHPTYLFHAERVIRRIVSRFRNHPAVIGYQIDNETGPYGTAGKNVQSGFVEYLKKTHHIEIHVRHAQRLIKKLGYSLRRPMYRFVQAKQEGVEEFRKTLKKSPHGDQ